MYFLLASRGVCVVVNTSFRTWINATGRWNRLYMTLRTKIIGSLRLIFMDYGIYSVHLGWENRVAGFEASYRDLVFLLFIIVIMILICFFQSRALNASVPLSSTLSLDDCHGGIITIRLVIQLTMMTAEQFPSSKDLDLKKHKTVNDLKGGGGRLRD